MPGATLSSVDANTTRIRQVKCKKNRHLCQMTRHRLCAVVMIHVSVELTCMNIICCLKNIQVSVRLIEFSVILGFLWVASILVVWRKYESANATICMYLPARYLVKRQLFISRTGIVFCVRIENNGAQRMLVA